MKKKIFGLILSFMLILSQCWQPVYAVTTTEWTGQTVSGGEWIISSGKTVEINDSNADIYFENATLTIEDGASLIVKDGILRFNQSTVNGTVTIVESGTVRPWGDITTMDKIVVDGGTLWAAPGATLNKLELNEGTGDVFGTSISELTQNGGELFVTDPNYVYPVITNYILNDGILNCKNGGTIQNATINGGQAVVLTDSNTNRGGSISHADVKELGYLCLYDAGASVNSVNIDWGSNFSDSDYPYLLNYGTINEFKGSGGYVKNFGTVTKVNLLDDSQNMTGVDFRNGYWSDEYTPGIVDNLTMEYGWFFNDQNSTLNSITAYDGFITHFSNVPIQSIELLQSKTPGKDFSSPNGASLVVYGPSIIHQLKFSQGDLTMYDSDDNHGAIINTLSKTSDFAGVISMDRYSEIKNELTGMASVSWNEPLNGTIKITLDGKELVNGSMIADGSNIEISVLPTDSHYKLKSNSLTANDISINVGSYTINGDTTFSAAFILATQAQVWDGKSSIFIPDIYEITEPITITNNISICVGAEIFLTDNGSLTINGTGALQNHGIIHGLVTLSTKQTKMTLDNLINYGEIDKVTAESGTYLINYNSIILLNNIGGNAKNNKHIENATITQNGTLVNSSSSALTNHIKVISGNLQNYFGGIIENLEISGGLAENSGSTMKNVSLFNGKIVNSNSTLNNGVIEYMKVHSGTIENQEKAIINKLELLDNNNVILENNGIIQQQIGNIITGYQLDDNSLTVTENAYFNTDPSVTITWNPVVPIGSNTTAPVEYHLRVYDNEALSGDPISEVTYSAKTTLGGASGSKLKHNTTYYFVLEAKIIGGNIEKDRVFTYKTQAVTTMPNPEEVGALNVDKITLKAGDSFQFIAYDSLGRPVTNIPLIWSVQAYPGNKMTSKETYISDNGLLHIGIDETAKQLLVGCLRGDGYLTSYNAVITVSDEMSDVYPITVNATEGGKAWSTVDSAEEDAIVLLFAEAEEGYMFDYWETTAGEILIPTNDTPFTRLMMPNTAVTVTAHFSKIPESEIVDDTNAPNTGDITNYASFLLLFISSLGAILWLKKKEQ